MPPWLFTQTFALKSVRITSSGLSLNPKWSQMPASDDGLAASQVKKSRLSAAVIKSTE